MIRAIVRYFQRKSDQLLKNKIFKTRGIFIDRGVLGWKLVSFGGNNSVGQEACFSSPVQIGYGTTVGPYNVIAGPVIIGPYCQLGQFVGIFGQEHPKSHLTTYINFRLFDGQLKNNVIHKEIKIEAGVWIGQSVVILKGVHIHAGAIIGAGSVVTKDVPEFAIVGGNPARLLRYRFPDEYLEVFHKIQWWNLTSEKIKLLEPFFYNDYSEVTLENSALLKTLYQRYLELSEIPQK